MKRLIMMSLTVASTIVAFSNYSNATDWNQLFIGGSAGRYYPHKPTEFKDGTDEGNMWEAHLGYVIAHDFSLIGSYSNIQLDQKNSDLDLDFQPILLSFKYHPLRDKVVSPYLLAGAGVSSNRMQVAENDSVRWNKFAGQAGVGIDFFLNHNFSIGVEGLYSYIRGTEEGLSSYRGAIAAATANVYFGRSADERKARDAESKARADQQRADAEAQKQKDEAAAAAAAAAAAQQTSAEAQRQAAEVQAQRDAALASAATAQAQTDAMKEQATKAQAEVDELKNQMASKNIESIKFKSGDATLLVDSYPTLDKVADIVKRYPDLSLRVEGHTDSVGDDNANLKLSQRRAETVRKYLLSKGGSEKNITAAGLGETQPVGSNDTAEGREQNRRVEFHFANK